MRFYVICFAAGVWWLQTQAQLPALHGYWLAAPAALVMLAAVRIQSPHWVRASRLAAAACCVACGFLWAAWFAQQRLSDALPIG